MASSSPELAARHERAVARALDGLARSGRLRRGAAAPACEIPALYDGTLEARGSNELLLGHYLDGLPSLRVELLWGADPAAALIFHSPLDWERLPRLRGALERLGNARWGRTLAEHYAGTCFGAWLPPLYGYPADVEAYAGEVAAGRDLHEVIDDRLAAPLLHEHCHFGRRRTGLPLMLDECVAGHLGVSLLRGTAYPEPGRDHAMVGAPWFSQIGQALERVIGREALVAAQSGRIAWDAVAPPGLLAAAHALEARRQAAEPGPNLLPGFSRPEAWIGLIYSAAVGRIPGLDALDDLRLSDLATGPVTDADRAIVRDALAAMCLEPRREGLCFRVRQAPPLGQVTVDAVRGWVQAPPRPLDTAPPRYPLAPAVAARLVAAGHERLTLDLSPEGVDAVAAMLFDAQTC